MGTEVSCECEPLYCQETASQWQISMSDILVFVKFNQTANTETAMLSTFMALYYLQPKVKLFNWIDLHIVIATICKSGNFSAPFRHVLGTLGKSISSVPGWPAIWLMNPGLILIWWISYMVNILILWIFSIVNMDFDEYRGVKFYHYGQPDCKIPASFYDSPIPSG